MEHENITTQAQAMQTHVVSCKASGVTVKAYCRRHQIKSSCYYYWQNKLRLQPAGKFISITPLFANAPVIILFTNGTAFVLKVCRHLII